MMTSEGDIIFTYTALERYVLRHILLELDLQISGDGDTMRSGYRRKLNFNIRRLVYYAFSLTYLFALLIVYTVQHSGVCCTVVAWHLQTSRWHCLFAGKALHVCLYVQRDLQKSPVVEIHKGHCLGEPSPKHHCLHSVAQNILQSHACDP